MVQSLPDIDKAFITHHKRAKWAELLSWSNGNVKHGRRYMYTPFVLRKCLPQHANHDDHAQHASSVGGCTTCACMISLVWLER